MSDKKHILIAGETYSPNTGDGAIAETLAFLFSVQNANRRVELVDLSGRRGWDQQSIKLESIIGSGKQSLVYRVFPRSWINLGKWILRRRNTLANLWLPALKRADCLVIGGGQLIMDNDLRFPLSLYQITHLARKIGIEIHFVACGIGIGRPWSRLGKFLLSDALGSAETISLRDELSQYVLRSVFPQLRTEVTFDPAVWADNVYGPEMSEDKQPLVGLGFMDIESINLNNPDCVPMSRIDWIHYWIEIIAELQRRGLAFVLFTNGDPRDDYYACELGLEASKKLNIPNPMAPRPQNPSELVAIIKQCRVVMAARLHANLIAFSYRIPIVGLNWDAKLPRFYKDINRSRFLFNIYKVSPLEVVQAIEEAMNIRIDESRLQDLRQRAFRSVEIINAYSNVDH